MIRLNNLDYSYNVGGVALSSVSLSVAKGAVVGLVGANGSGKSTLMSVLAGLYTPTAGRAEIGGLQSPGKEKKIRTFSRMVMQDADLQILGGTVEEDILMGRQRSESVLAAAKAMAEQLRLLESWSTPVHALSWGMKRKLCLATALLDAPQVLLLDEPFSGLDFPGKMEMRRIIGENRKRGLTQVISSHDLGCLVDLVDDLAVMSEGRLVLNGKPEAVLDEVLQYDVRPPYSWRKARTIVPWDSED